MSIVEKIRQAQQTQAEADAQIEKEDTEQQGRVLSEYEMKRKRIEALINRGKEALQIHGVLNTFQQIEKELLQDKWKYHETIQDPWGISLHWSDTNGDFDNSKFGCDFYGVTASIEQSGENVRVNIRGEWPIFIDEQEWKQKELFDSAIIEAYLHPNHTYLRRPETSVDSKW